MTRRAKIAHGRLAPALVAAVAAACGGHSELETQADRDASGSAGGDTSDDGGIASSGASSGVHSPSTGGAGNPSPGGAGGAGNPSPGGAGNPSPGGAGNPSTGGAAPGSATPARCTGIRSNQTCETEGTECANLPCGIADTGRRTCTCSTTWACTACDFSNSPLPDPPDPIPSCPAEAADGVSCATRWDICGPLGSEICVCYVGPEGVLIWDCDRPPVCDWC